MSSLIAWWDFEEPLLSTKFAAHNGDPVFELTSGAVDTYAANSNPKTGAGHLTHDGSSAGETPILPDQATLNPTGSLTFTGWIRPTGSIPGSPSDARTVFSKWQATVGERGYWLNYSDAGNFRWGIQNEENTEFTASPSVAPALDQWFFFAAWIDFENSVIGLQINDEVAETAVTGTPRKPTVPHFALYRIYSGFGGLASVNIGQGDIDAFDVWSRALSKPERDLLRNDGNGWTHATFPGFGPETPEEIFNVQFAEALGRDAQVTALTQRTPAQQLANTNVYVFSFQPWLATKPIFVGLGELHKTRSGKMIWISDPDDPGFWPGRWCQIQSRRGTARPGEVLLTVRCSDHPESLIPPPELANG